MGALHSWRETGKCRHGSRAGERRLLADLVALEVSEDLGADALSGFARSDSFAAAGRSVDSLSEITQVYEAGV
jgi:hypothetical protein